jgi:hypothetical protein
MRESSQMPSQALTFIAGDAREFKEGECLCIRRSLATLFPIALQQHFHAAEKIKSW